MAQGKFSVLGPVALFAADDSSSAGLVALELKSPEPSVIDPGPEFLGDVKTLVQKDAGTLPLDPSLGNARKIAATQDTLIEHWQKGGPVMWPILGLGFVSLLVGIFKWVQVGRIRKLSARDVQIVLEHLRGDRQRAAVEHAERLGGPSGRLLKEAVEHAGDDKELLEEVLYEQMLDTRPRLERLMPLIALTAATAPLLGLLGTVTGMINTFNLISVFGTGDPRMLSSGISEALITTEYGLIVAIPALLIHAVVTRQTKGLLGSMEQAAVSFINGLPSRRETKS
jgi:biopolymer transport protein ExbB